MTTTATTEKDKGREGDLRARSPLDNALPVLTKPLTDHSIASCLRAAIPVAAVTAYHDSSK
jgi:hypothetical protein